MNPEAAKTIVSDLRRIPIGQARMHITADGRALREKLREAEEYKIVEALRDVATSHWRTRKKETLTLGKALRDLGNAIGEKCIAFVKALRAGLRKWRLK